MTPAQLAELMPFDEDRDIQIQKACQKDLDELVNEMFGLIQVADMPEKTRQHMLRGLLHLSGHLRGELKELTNEVEGRVN